jgi:hypothetical protein
MKNKTIFPIVLFLAGAFFTSSLQAQEITSNAAYKARMDSLSNAFSAVVQEWNEAIPPHFRKAMKLEKEAEANPELKDSLLAIAAEERKIGEAFMPALQARMDSNQEERQALQEKYSLVFEDAFPYFRLRKKIAKGSLAVLLSKASAEIQASETGKALRYFIDNPQFVVGSRFQTFPCYDVDGNSFDWGLIKGKKVFLVHDGLWCMTHGQDNSLFGKYLHYLSEAAPNCLPLVFVDCATPEDLKEAIEEYGLQDFYVVSEYKKDFGMLNVFYNDQTTPTCHYIDEQGIVVKTTEAIDQDYLEKEFLKIK